MLPDYRTITDRIKTDPVWFDEHGVPRYDSFSPEDLGVYDTFAALFEIACQACRKHFLVGLGWNTHKALREHLVTVGLLASERFVPPNPKWEFPTLERLIDCHHYGDPPRHDCPGAGETMNCADLYVREAWERYQHRSTDIIGGQEHTVLVQPYGWERRSDLEGKMDVDDWEEDLL